MAYRFIDHTADIKVQVKSKNLEDAFINSALALKEAIIGKLKISKKFSRIIKIKGRDKKRLLYEFLEQFLYLLDAKDFLLSELEYLRINKEKKGVKQGFSLQAKVLGDKASGYSFTNNVKAITYSNMEIKEKKITEILFILDV